MAALLVLSSGCTPIADNNQRSGETPQSSAAGETAQSSIPEQTSDDGRTGGEQNGSPSMPFIAEAKAVFPVINVANPGRLEVVDGCLTVSVRGRERATAVFPPGVKPELQGNEVVAVSFEGRRVPVGQEAPIPGGVIRLSSAELVKPIPTYCPETLFGLGG
jgi:hypothetical protein